MVCRERTAQALPGKHLPGQHDWARASALCIGMYLLCEIMYRLQQYAPTSSCRPACAFNVQADGQVTMVDSRGASVSSSPSKAAAAAAAASGPGVAENGQTSGQQLQQQEAERRFF